MKIKTILLALMLIVGIETMRAQGTAAATTPNESDKIVGIWETGTGKARVNIIKSGKFFYGRIVWFSLFI